MHTYTRAKTKVSSDQEETGAYESKYALHLIQQSVITGEELGANLFFDSAANLIWNEDEMETVSLLEQKWMCSSTLSQTEKKCVCTLKEIWLIKNRSDLKFGSFLQKYWANNCSFFSGGHG